MDYFLEDRNASPQEYWYNLIGNDEFRNYFADFAIHNAADMDYLTREEFEISKNNYYRILQNEINTECANNVCDLHSYVWEAKDAGTNDWQRPPKDLTTRGWSYNVWRVNVTKAADYT